MHKDADPVFYQDVYIYSASDFDKYGDGSTNANADVFGYGNGVGNKFRHFYSDHTIHKHNNRNKHPDHDSDDTIYAKLYLDTV